MLHKCVATTVLLAGSMVGLPYMAVNGGLSRPASKAWADGSPMPVPKPTGGRLVADGSPMPVAKPTAIRELTADGLPIPIPKLTSAIAQAA